MHESHRRSALASALVVLSLLSCACSGDSHAPTQMLEPPGIDIGGEWSTTTVETRDTCGFDPFPPQSPLLVEEAAASAIFTFVGSSGICERSVRDRIGEVVTLSRTDTFDAGCAVVMVQSTMTYEFGEDGFSGTAHHVYTNVDGACANLPCEYELSIAGVRCDGCWPGCADVQSQSVPEAPTGGAARLRAL
jgi:hypothetical protein